MTDDCPEIWGLQVAAELAFAKSRGLEDWQPGEEPEEWERVDGHIVRYAGRDHDRIDLFAYGGLVRPAYPNDALLVFVTGAWEPERGFMVHEPVRVSVVRRGAVDREHWRVYRYWSPARMEVIR